MSLRQYGQDQEGGALYHDKGAKLFRPVDRCVPGLYNADKTITAAAAVREAIPVNEDGVKAKSLRLRNRDATNFFRFKFGDVLVVADLTSGDYVGPNEAPPDFPVPQDDDATHVSLRANAADVVAVAVWGF